MLDSFRPFAGKFVETTFDKYIHKRDRSVVSTSSDRTEGSKKVDISKLYPYKYTEDDLQLRVNTFMQLKDKVLRQREAIKQNDDKFEMIKLKLKDDKVLKDNALRLAKQDLQSRLKQLVNAIPAKRHTFKRREPRMQPMNRASPTSGLFALTAPKTDLVLRSLDTPRLNGLSGANTTEPDDGQLFPIKDAYSKQQSRDTKLRDQLPALPRLKGSEREYIRDKGDFSQERAQRARRL
jgi:hypothetical protein